jgi:hypothetical protein
MPDTQVDPPAATSPDGTAPPTERLPEGRGGFFKTFQDFWKNLTFLAVILGVGFTGHFLLQKEVEKAKSDILAKNDAELEALRTRLTSVRFYLAEAEWNQFKLECLNGKGNQFDQNAKTCDVYDKGTDTFKTKKFNFPAHLIDAEELSKSLFSQPSPP